MVQHILNFLLDSTAFADYIHRSDPALTPPTPIEPLPTGPESRAHVHMLAAVLIDEKDYEGNAKLVPGEFLRQLSLDDDEYRRKMGSSL